jgi:hypothetical protein
MDEETRRRFDQLDSKQEEIMEKLNQIQGEVIAFGSGELKPRGFWG